MIIPKIWKKNVPNPQPDGIDLTTVKKNVNFGSAPQAWKNNEHTLPEQCCIFLQECPTMFKECNTLVNGKNAKK